MVDVLNTPDFLVAVKERADRDFDREHATERGQWLQSISTLLVRAHERGDGVAVYENADLGHPDLGQWQIVSYGGLDAQLETREDYGQTEEELATPDYFHVGDDVLRTTLPDIGGRINWRYTLKIVCPA